MNLPRLAIRRPIAVIMIVAVATLLGAYAASRLTIDLLPDVTIPVAVAFAQYPGAGPLEIERMVTRPLEEAAGAVTNVRSVRSQSFEEGCFVVAEFNWGTDMEFAALDMREKIEQVRRFLPDDAEAPIVMKIDPSMIPFLQLSLSGGRDLASLTALAEDLIKGRLERLEGVAAVDVIGGRRREISVAVDLDRMYYHGTDLQSIVQTLRLENLNLPGGRLEEGRQRLLVRSVGEFATASDIAAIPISSPLGGMVELGQLARVSSGYAVETQRARLDGEPSLGLSIQKRPDANTVEVSRRVLAAMSDLQSELPGDVRFEVATNSARFITTAVSNVVVNALLGALLAVIVLFLFLQSVRSTLVIAIAIPTSVISSLALVYLSGMTLNLMSLGGLALGIGMLVDTAIVVLENIFRHRQSGLDAVEAADVGANEVSGAVFAATLTTVGVFVPVAFLSGMASELFRELALTVSFSLLASLAVSLTLVPMISARLFRRAPTRSASPWLASMSDLLNDRMRARYRRALAWTLNRRVGVFTAALIVFGLSLMLTRVIGSEFMPPVDTGEFVVDVALPRGGVLADTDRAVAEVEARLLDDNRVATVFATTGSGGAGFRLGGGGETDRGSVTATVSKQALGGMSTYQFVEELRAELSEIPGAEIDVRVSTGFIGAMAEAPIMVTFSGDDLDVLEELTRQATVLMERVAGVRDVRVSSEEGQPELRVVVDRTRAADVGLSSAAIGMAVNTAVQGDIATRLRAEGEEIDVRVIASEPYTVSARALGDLKLLSRAGYLVSLSEVASLVPARGPTSIHRQGQARTMSLSAQISGRSLGDVAADVEKALEQLKLPLGYGVEVGGEREQMMDAFSTLGTAAVMAVLLVYAILAAQFESLAQPLVIMLTLPLALIGVLASLALTGRTLNIASYLGTIMLAGIVVNNAIVMIDYLNRLRVRGLERRDAVLSAAETRLRPILMTSLTTVLALLPLALGISEGAELQTPLATVVVGGLLLSTVLTLFVVPTAYELVDDAVIRLYAGRKRS